MAACGTPLVAARGGIVQYAGYEANAGNYVVIDGKGTPNDFMYAHLAEPSPLQTGDTVRTGQPIGIVGDTGDATACHLHFEMWGAPGWYEGGSPVRSPALSRKVGRLQLMTRDGGEVGIPPPTASRPKVSPRNARSAPAARRRAR